MRYANTSSRYGAVSQFFHWLTVVLVVVLLVSGMAGDIEPEEGNTLFTWHSMLGMLVFVLVTLRLLWRFVSPPPHLPEAMPAFSRGAAKVLHLLFYVLLVALPLSGWIMSSAEGAMVSFFGMTLPGFAPFAGTEAETWEALHEVLGNILLGVAILHMLAALKHHFVDRDDVLRRMLPGRYPPGK